MASNPYQLIGGATLVDGPGFRTPLFRNADSNGLWIQQFASSERVSAFLRIETPMLRVADANVMISQEVGSLALYIYRDSGRATHVGTRTELSPIVRWDYGHLEGRPHLQRSIARFVDDAALLKEATRAVADRDRQRTSSPTIPSPNFSLVIRDIFREALKLAGGGQNIVVYGRKGSGKTALLSWLTNELRAQTGTLVLRSGAGRNRAAFDELLIEAMLRERKRLPGPAGKILDNAALLWRPSGALPSPEVRAMIERCLQLIMYEARVVIVVDDAHLLLRDRDNAVASRDRMLSLSQNGVSFILATDDTVWINSPSPPFWPEHFDSGHDYVDLQIPPLSRTEVSHLLRARIADMPESNLRDPNLTQLSTLLSGFHARDLLEIFNWAYPHGGFEKREIQGRITERCDRILDAKLLSYSDGSFHPRSVAESILSVVASSGTDGVKIEELQAAAMEAGAGKTASALVIWLVSFGLISVDRSGTTRFSHRLIEEWWRHRKNLRGKRR